MERGKKSEKEEEDKWILREEWTRWAQFEGE